MKNSVKVLLITALLSLFMASSCSDDSTGPDIPDKGTISGTVTFTGTWPATGEIQVSLWTALDPTTYAPTGAPAGATEAIAQTGSYEFSFEGLDDGEYVAIYVGWRDPADPTGARLLGMYWTNPSDAGVVELEVAPGVFVTAPVAAPSTITVSESNRVVSNVNITANLDLWQ
ncbi:MAG TPA: hypothetical protein PKV71_09725 [Calditrichia bacterium]|nr:hypothetical protein [Calditrichota bacterium]HQU73453.1 hypothetical protein [Calditrichia bacterium]HQV32143.1 hypothetical protein [Calditrichia bacterium]